MYIKYIHTFGLDNIALKYTSCLQRKDAARAWSRAATVCHSTSNTTRARSAEVWGKLQKYYQVGWDMGYFAGVVSSEWLLYQ